MVLPRSSRGQPRCSLSVPRDGDAVRALAAWVKYFFKRYNACMNAESVKPRNVNAGLLLQECLCRAVKHVGAILKHQVRYSCLDSWVSDLYPC